MATDLIDARRDTSAGGDDRPVVLQVVDSLEPGGAQQVVLRLAGWLVERGIPVVIVGAEGDFDRRLPNGVGRWITRDRPLPWEIVRAASATGASVLHAHQRREALSALIAGRILGIPVVEHAHTVLPNSGVRALSFRSRRIYSVSPAVTRMVRERFGRPAERIRTIGNVAPEWSADPVAARPLGSAALRVLGIGRLVDQKDPLRFVCVVHELNHLRPVAARWIGTGPLLAPARDLAERLGAPVEFAGLSDRVIDELDDADLLLMTSRWEGAPLAAIEAHARARPVFATASSGVDFGPGLRDRYELPDAMSHEQVARRIDAILRLGDGGAVLADALAARERVRTTRTPEAVFEPVLDDYRELARGARRVTSG